ncbi:MAG: lycopene cyclase domain-containing protein [Aggregatilineales bacterium]
MKYFSFLIRFVILPLFVMRLLVWRDRKNSIQPPTALQNWDEDTVLFAHVAVAVGYTTLWDNYLVANKVWSYDPDLVTGITIGYVPIEEYSFFVLQTLLTGTWAQFLAARMPIDNSPYRTTHPAFRATTTAAVGLVWALSARRLIQDRKNYLHLILTWALPPIMIQTALGGDILWRHRKLILASILPATAYLGATDSLAIESGTWTINPENITGLNAISKHLPFEELLFFFLTNVLLVFGVTLVQAKESENRLPEMLKPYYTRFKQKILDNRL